MSEETKDHLKADSYASDDIKTYTDMHEHTTGSIPATEGVSSGWKNTPEYGADEFIFNEIDIDGDDADEAYYEDCDTEYSDDTEYSHEAVCSDDGDYPDDEKPDKGYPFTIILVAVALLVFLSLIPWGEKTQNFLKDYNLIGDLLPQRNDSILESTEMLDPELLALDEGAVEPQLTDSVPVVSEENTALSDNPPLGPVIERDVPDCVVKENGMVVLEDYTEGGSGLRNLKNALVRRENRPVHIAMMGDSYIEGDIITMELRDRLQEKYGGRGVGYVAAHSAVQGFRTTVRHKDSGWKHHPIKEAAGTHYFTIAGEYYTGQKGATITLNGVEKNDRLSGWNSTRLLFIAPNSGIITLAAGGTTHTFDITGESGVQSILLPAETSSVKISSDIADLKMLGVWLEDTNGVVVDNMSIRGDSGIGRRTTNVSLAHQMRDFIDYDLIIVEFGINALSSKQTNYTKYSNTMTDVLRRLKQCYPAADIILMGIGDRGQKIQGVPRSFPTAQYMVDAQRQAAKNAGVMFWDTREAMGGEDAIVRWRDEKLANGDYIHLNHAGGKRLGNALYQSIEAAINGK